MTDWKLEIVKAVMVQERLQELDVRSLWSYHLPELAASEHDIYVLEKRLGYRLDEKYRKFLLCANGWKSFYQDVDIFGTKELMGSSLMDAAGQQLDVIGSKLFFDNTGLEVQNVLPIAASMQQPDMFLLVLPGTSEAGSVVWVAGSEVERFVGFEEYYLAMVDYNRRRIQRFEEGWGK